MSGGLQFRSAPVVNGRMLLVEYAVTAWIPVVCVREALTTRQPVDEIIQLLFIAAMTVFILGWVTWSWIGFRRFGESVCRISALPAPGAASVRDYRRHWTPVHLDFVVDDVSAAVARAVAAGAKLEGGIQSFGWGRQATLGDPFGHGFCLLQFSGEGYDSAA